MAKRVNYAETAKQRSQSNRKNPSPRAHPSEVRRLAADRRHRKAGRSEQIRLAVLRLTRSPGRCGRFLCRAHDENPPPDEHACCHLAG